MKEITDAHILGLIRAPQSAEQGFRLLLQQYQVPLYRHVFRLVGSHDDTNDVLQNVFVKVFRFVHTFEGQSALFTWLYKVATNEALSFLSQKKRHSVAPLEGVEVPTTSTPTDAERIEACLAQAVALLPEKQRAVFCLRYYDEMPYEAMADILDTSVGALKASYHHAVKKIEAFVKSVAV